MKRQYRYFALYEIGRPNQSIEEFRRKQDAVTAAQMWVGSPVRTGPRTAQVVREGERVVILASYESPK